MRPKSGPNPDSGGFRVYYDENGIPVSVKDLVPFHEKSFTDEAGYEAFERHYLVFDFEVGGLMVEVTRTWANAEFSYGFVELDRLDRKVREALIRSGRLEAMRAKVLETAREALTKIAQMTDLPDDAFRQADSLEKEVYGIFEQAIAGMRQS
jgi:hypothetical protein